MGIEKEFLEKLHKAGIGKSTEHVFVYRYPDSDEMPLMDSEKFLQEAEKGKGSVKELAFYLHVPFCTSICSYCHYYTELPAGEKATTAFLSAIEKEIVSYRKILGESIAVNSVLFGGGTPTVLEAGQLNGLMLFLQGGFPMPKKTEATVESSPETLNLKKLAELRQNFNRLSIGVQDFDDKALKACGRNHGKGQAMQAIKDARNAGFENINIDLIYGLPLQGINGWKNTLEEIEALQPESVTASDLRIQKGSAFFENGGREFATEEELIEMHSMFIEKMLSLGYEQLFPYQFVKKGREMRFLQNQWSNKDYVGFGPSSCSFLNAWDYNNVFPLGEYLKSMEEGDFAFAVGKKLSKKELMARHVALGLKNAQGISKKDFEKEFGTGIEGEFGKQVELLESLGLVENSERTLKLSGKGMFFYDAVSRKFFPEKAKSISSSR